jgi:hypothetical protein
MSFDHFAKLATEQAWPKEHAVEAFGLASGSVDGCTTRSAVNALLAAECEAWLEREQDKNRKKGLEQKKGGTSAPRTRRGTAIRSRRPPVRSEFPPSSISIRTPEHLC